MYDPQNIFAKIIRGEIPAQVVYEDDNVLAFQDIHPKAPVHLLVIPKGPYATFADFTREASAAQVAHFWAVVTHLCKGEQLESGYRLVSNNGAHGGQEVPHFHVHLLGGTTLPPF